MGTDRTSMRAILPPCRICGSKASGCHYGVNSCQGCRMFFRRCITRSSPPVCASQGDCSAKSKRAKTGCVACRYQKCLDMGMTKNSKKTGRYTYAQRTTYLEEMQELEIRKQVNVRDAQLLNAQEREQELDKIVVDLTKIYLKQIQTRNEDLSVITKRETQRNEEDQLLQSLFGSMTPIPMSDYMRVYKSTGVDIDGRRENMQKMLPEIERDTIKHIQFTEAIPGFGKLPIKDQRAVLKATPVESDIMTSFHTFHPEYMTYVPLDEQAVTFTCSDMALHFGEDSIELYRRCVVTLQSLDLTPEEHAVLYAYLLLTGDADLSSEGRRLIGPMQETMADVFYRLVQRNHDNATDTYITKVTSALLLVKTAVHVWDKEHDKVVQAYPDLPWPQIVRQLYFD